jgi:hypothetical protein
MRRILSTIAVLRNEYAALRLQSTGNGIFVVTLADWLFPPPQPAWGVDEKPELPVKEEEEESSHLQTHLPDEREIPPPPTGLDHSDRPPSKPRARSGKYSLTHRAGTVGRHIDRKNFTQALVEHAAYGYEIGLAKAGHFSVIPARWHRLP